MSYDPDLDFETDIEELPAEQAKDRVEDVTNMTVAEAERLTETERFERYEKAASGRQGRDPPIPGGPTEDFIHLMETPASEWGDDEFQEADELVNYASRTVPQFDDDEGEPLLPEEEPRVHKGEMALLTWGVDMKPDDGFP